MTERIVQRRAAYFFLLASFGHFHSVYAEERVTVTLPRADSKESGTQSDPALGPAKVRLQVRQLFADLNYAFQTGQRARFTALVAELRKIAPATPEAEYFQGLLLYRDGERIKAAAHIKEALTRDSDFDRAWNLLGTILMESARYEEARSAFQRASSLNAYDPHYALNAALCSYYLNDLTEAYGYAARAADLKPNAVEVQFLLGLILLDLQKPVPALAALDQAYILGQRSPDFVVAYLKAAETSGNALEMARVLDVLTSDDRFVVQRGIAEARARWGECERALRIYDRILASGNAVIADRLNYVTCAVKNGRDTAPAYIRVSESDRVKLEAHEAAAQKRNRFSPRDAIINPVRS